MMCIWLLVPGDDDTHGDHSYTSSTYCEDNENDSDCIPSTSADNTYSKPPPYLETCVYLVTDF